MRIPLSSPLRGGGLVVLSLVVILVLGLLVVLVLVVHGSVEHDHEQHVN